MNYRNTWTTLGIGAALFLASCQSTEGESTRTDEVDSVDQPTLVDLPSASPEFPDARLSLTDWKTQEAGDDSVLIRFSFKVDNYELKSQTADAASKNCNNSAQGQHIHFILNNEPYVALYEPHHEVKLAKNSEHYLLAFLSRSYHESIKSNGAALLKHFSVGQDGKIQEMDLPQNPMVFYSRPKGDYLGEDTKNLLFDYYIWNGQLGQDLQLTAQVNSASGTESFELNQWKPSFIQNMPMGESSIDLQLVDGSGQPISGPMTQVSRRFRLAEKEPMTP